MVIDHEGGAVTPRSNQAYSSSIGPLWIDSSSLVIKETLSGIKRMKSRRGSTFVERMVPDKLVWVVCGQKTSKVDLAETTTDTVLIQR
jgi:hypothetical protein